MKLRFVLLLLISFLWAPTAAGEEVERFEKETLEDFARRNGPPQSGLAHAVIETEAWGHKKTVIAFYETEFQLSGQTYERVVGYVFLPQAPNTYRKTLIGSFEPDGGSPKIEAAFFANADKDQAKELIVICSWLVRHYDVSGTLYRTYVFDDLRPGADPTKLS